MQNTTELMPLILSGDGYQLTISDEAIQRKSEMLSASSTIQIVGDNHESAVAQRHTRQLAAMRIEVEKSRKLVKEPVNWIGKMIDRAAAEFLIEINAEEGRIKRLIGNHAEEVLRIKAEAERVERAAFEAARAAREAAEEGGIAAVLAAKKAAAEKMEASAEVATTKIAEGVRFAWDFEVVDVGNLYFEQPELVQLIPIRGEIIAWLKGIEAENDRDPVAIAAICGIRAFKKPIVSSR